MNKTKIAILLTNFEGGGAQKVALTQAKALREENFDVKLILLEKSGNYTIPDDLDIIFLSKSDIKDSKYQKLSQFPRLLINLAKYLKKEKITLCISHLERADFINILSNFLYKHKTICIIHSNLSSNYKDRSFRSYLYSNLIRTIHNQANLLLPVSKGVEFDLIEMGLSKGKIQTVPNPFFIKEIHKQASIPLGQYKPIFKKDVIISVARLSKEKGVFHTIKIFAEIKKNNPKLRYIILGDGDLREHHINLAKKLKLKIYTIWDNQDIKEGYDIYFLGFSQNPFNFIANSKIYILSSQYEGLPNVIIESLICGTPIISTDVKSGPREILAPETDISISTDSIEYAKYGVLTKPIKNSNYLNSKKTLNPDENLLKQAIEKLLIDNNLRNSYIELSQERIQEFDYKKIVKIWKKIIKEYL